MTGLENTHSFPGRELAEGGSPRRTLRSAFIGDIPLSLASADEVLSVLGEAIERRSGRCQHICITNTESLYHAGKVPAHAQYIRDAVFSLCDGVGVILTGLAWGHRIRRLNGPVLQLLASDFGRQFGWRHYYYGGKPGVAEEMARRLTAKFPGLIVCGVSSPPFGRLSDEQRKAELERIGEAAPDIVWVGLGLLRQEQWIAENQASLRCPWAIGVGAAFDYHSGAIPWAPPALRRLGLEWLYRLWRQPRLRAQRYWWSLLYVLRQSFIGLVTLRFLRPKVEVRQID